VFVYVPSFTRHCHSFFVVLLARAAYRLVMAYYIMVMHPEFCQSVQSVLSVM